MTELDVHDDRPPEWAVLPASEVLKAASDTEGGVWPWQRRPNTPPVVQITDRYVTGTLDLRALEFGYILEFVRCRFELPPDLRQAQLAGIEFRGCRLPGLHARNMHSQNDIAVAGSTVAGGPVDLTDSQIEGSLVLEDSTLHNPGARALHANRLVLSGALLASRLTAEGELRMPALRVRGNLSLRGATLSNPDGHTLNLNAATIEGNLLCASEPEDGRPFGSTGLIFVTGARIAGAFALRGARLRPKEHDADPPPHDDPYYDVRAAVIADRIEVNGNALFDGGLRSSGTLRMVNAHIHGSVRLAGSTLDMSRASGRLRALNLDGTTIGSDFNARDLTLRGQARMVAVTVHGHAGFERSVFYNPGEDVIEARQLTVGGSFECQAMRAHGSTSLQGAHIAVKFDLRGALFANPGEHNRDGSAKPLLDMRASRVGRDLVLGSTEDPCVLRGKLRLDRCTIGSTLNLHGVLLGAAVTESDLALDATALQVQQLVLTPGEPPRGAVVLRHANCTSLDDNAELYASVGSVDLEDFRFESFAHPVHVTDDARVGTRIDWLRTALGGEYRPGPYDQLAAVLRASGNDEHASTVLLRKQQQRFGALGRGYRLLRPVVWVWSALQWVVVGYGYRPMRALGWLILLLAAGTAWFSVAGPLHVINADDHLPWNPFLYTLDLLIPIVDFGNKERWQVFGMSQWFATVLTASGWILATTVAAGLSRMLRRNA